MDPSLPKDMQQYYQEAYPGQQHVSMQNRSFPPPRTSILVNAMLSNVEDPNFNATNIITTAVKDNGMTVAEVTRHVVEDIGGDWLWCICQRAASTRENGAKAVILNYGAGYHSFIRLEDVAVSESGAPVLNVGISVTRGSHEVDVATTGVMSPYDLMWDVVGSVEGPPRVWVRTDRGVIWPQLSLGEDPQLRRDLILLEEPDGEQRTTFRLRKLNNDEIEAAKPKKRSKPLTKKKKELVKETKEDTSDEKRKPPAGKKRHKPSAKKTVADTEEQESSDEEKKPPAAKKRRKKAAPRKSGDSSDADSSDEDSSDKEKKPDAKKQQSKKPSTKRAATPTNEEESSNEDEKPPAKKKGRRRAKKKPTGKEDAPVNEGGFTLEEEQIMMSEFLGVMSPHEQINRWRFNESEERLLTEAFYADMTPEGEPVEPMKPLVPKSATGARSTPKKKAASKPTGEKTTPKKKEEKQDDDSGTEASDQEETPKKKPRKKKKKTPARDDQEETQEEPKSSRKVSTSSSKKKSTSDEKVKTPKKSSGKSKKGSSSSKKSSKKKKKSGTDESSEE